MAAEPITLFARIADPAGVGRRLRELVPGVRIDGPDDNWRKAVVTSGRLWKKRTLTLTHDRDYCAEPNWSTQMNGMRGYFAGFPETDRKARALMLPTTFRFSLGTIFDPDPDPNGDPRLDVLLAITELLDGVLFTPTAFRDARGRILFGAGGEDEEDPNATWPRVILQVSATDPIGAAAHEESRPKSADEEPLSTPPDAQRVARRALALTAVTVRALLEQDPPDDRSSRRHNNLFGWVKELGIGDELEPDEWEVLQTPPGRLSQRAQIDSTWRLEGLVVLAWALGQFDIPPHDQLVDFQSLWKRLGWGDLNAARRLLRRPTLRSHSAINELRNRLFAAHWRLRNHNLNRQVLDFAEFARTCWFGPLDLTGLPLANGDLAVGGIRLDQADRDALEAAHSAARERHQAANWLRDGPARYSEACLAT